MYDRADIENLCRHIYLIASQTPMPTDWDKDELVDVWQVEREEIIKECVDVLVSKGFMCYGDICGSIKHTNEDL